MYLFDSSVCKAAFNQAFLDCTDINLSHQNDYTFTCVLCIYSDSELLCCELHDNVCLGWYFVLKT